MQASTKHGLTIALVVVLVVLIGIWWASDFSLDFMRFFASDGGSGTPAVGVNQPATPTPPAGAVGCAPATQTVAVGASVTLTGSGGQSSYEWVAPEGTPSTGSGASFTTTYATVGTKKVIVSGARQTQETDTNRVPQDSVACTVVVTAE